LKEAIANANACGEVAWEQMRWRVNRPRTSTERLDDCTLEVDDEWDDADAHDLGRDTKQQCLLRCTPHLYYILNKRSHIRK
jgi:hypothetical protein